MTRPIDELYEQLKGSRMRGGLFWMDGFTDADYEALFEYLVEQFVADDLDGGDFFIWLRDKSFRYFHHRSQNKFFADAEYDPLLSVRPEDMNTRQMLAVIKFAIYRKRYYHYKRKKVAR